MKSKKTNILYRFIRKNCTTWRPLGRNHGNSLGFMHQLPRPFSCLHMFGILMYGFCKLCFCWCKPRFLPTNPRNRTGRIQSRCPEMDVYLSLRGPFPTLFFRKWKARSFGWFAASIHHFGVAGDLDHLGVSKKKRAQSLVLNCSESFNMDFRMTSSILAA